MQEKRIVSAIVHVCMCMCVPECVCEHVWLRISGKTVHDHDFALLTFLSAFAVFSPNGQSAKWPLRTVTMLIASLAQK